MLSRDGRLDAADRWYAGEGGPDTAMARQAPAHCGTCGFYLPLAGSLQAGFGACGNELSNSDGRVVSVEHGCGAHSEAVVEAPSLAELVGDVYDDGEIIELAEVPDLAELPEVVQPDVELHVEPEVEPAAELPQAADSVEVTEVSDAP